jgi:hypothetical protein
MAMDTIDKKTIKTKEDYDKAKNNANNMIVDNADVL